MHLRLPRSEPFAAGIFAGLSADERAALMAELETRSLKRGDVLVRQGDAADALYIVLSGRFVVTLEGHREAVTEIGPEQPIGEIAFLTGGVRTATVSAMRDSLVLRLGRDDFDRIAGKCPGIWRTLTTALSQRLAATTAAPEALAADPRPRTVAIIRAGTSHIPEPFLDMLTGAFSATANTLVVDARRAAELLPKALDSAEATRALNQLESSYDYLVFVTDSDLTSWSQKAIRHADLVLAVAVDGADPTPNALEQHAAAFVRPDAHRLAIVHARREQPISGTARWLRRRNLAMHHHVALDDVKTVARLYRFINGSALGLIACGGGALCAAHVGLYKALIESGFEFDALGGTSAGAAMTGAFAMGKHPDDIDRGTHDIFVTNRAMQRYTWPRYSLLDHRHYDAQLKRYFAGTNIEDLWIPYFAVSTNLSSYELRRHDRGDLFEAIRASGSIPVLLPPVYTAEGEMLVDGCLLDNVPVRIMHQMKSGPNVVVSFHIPELERFEVDYSTLPSRGDLIRMTINPLARSKLPDAPGLTTVLMRSLMANRHDFQRHLRPGDALFVPPIPADMGILDWHRHAELVRNAYWWGLEEVQRLRRAHHPLIGVIDEASSGAKPG